MFGSAEEKAKAKEELSLIAFGRSFSTDSNMSNNNGSSTSDDIDDNVSSSSSDA